MRTIKLLLAAGFLLVFGTSIHAQVQRNETYLPKFAIKTNALYWATSTPNVGIEVGLAKKLTLDISGNYNPWKFGDDRQIKHWLVQPELRYWLCERFNGSFFGLHGHYGEMNVSNLNIFGMGHDRYDGNVYGGVFPCPNVRRVRTAAMPAGMLFATCCFPIHTRSAAVTLFKVGPTHMAAPVNAAILRNLRRLISLSLSIFDSL